MRDPKNQMLGTMVPPLMQLSVKMKVPSEDTQCLKFWAAHNIPLSLRGKMTDKYKASIQEKSSISFHFSYNLYLMGIESHPSNGARKTP